MGRSMNSDTPRRPPQTGRKARRVHHADQEGGLEGLTSASIRPVHGEHRHRQQAKKNTAYLTHFSGRARLAAAGLEALEALAIPIL